ncbi:hypothetical protein MalM25_28320 [Planctomycetes bacterium MalM25]|nr:hypothetical protein MalM25_28320 [Planctomycetes bacterium MalM25]
MIVTHIPRARGGLAALVVLAIGCDSAPPAPAPVIVEPPAATPPVSAPPVPTPPSDGLVADNGRTLWASPTAGEAIDLSVVPSGSDLIVWLRPKPLLASEEGRRVWRALGPAGEAATAAIEARAGERLDAIDSLVVSVTSGESYESVEATLSIDPQPTDDLPLLQREIESLLESSDAERHLTLIFSPRFVLGGGGSMLQGPWEPLRDLLLAQTRDAWSAAALSAHVDDQARLYWELRLLTGADLPETRAALGLAKQASGWQADTSSVVDQTDWSPYSAEVIERSPAMMEVLGRYARRGVDGRQAVLNGYAPPGAAHQLLLVAERIVAELAAPPALPIASTAKETPLADLPLAERLRRPVSISFPRESLEAAVAILSETIATPITIVGRDLQLEGITRNQMLGLDETDRPAADVLVEMLRRANPDTEATGPADPRQRLVYIVRDGKIAITTRTAATKRGDTIPAPFAE